jgi:hypothetical protein
MRPRVPPTPPRLNGNLELSRRIISFVTHDEQKSLRCMRSHGLARARRDCPKTSEIARKRKRRKTAAVHRILEPANCVKIEASAIDDKDNAFVALEAKILMMSASDVSFGS